MFQQDKGAALTCLNRATHPSSVTASDRLQMPVSEQQETDLMWRQAQPRLARPLSRFTVRSLAPTRSTLASTWP